MQAVKTSFSKILQIEGTLEHYHIPKYQREYTWQKPQWSKLIQDIDENDAGHFMGSIICVMDGRELRPNEEKIYDLVDGQQRMTSLSLLMMAIYKKYKSLEESIDKEDEEALDSYRTSLGSIRKKLVKKKESEYADELGGFKDKKYDVFLRVQPSSQNNNLYDYKYILGELGMISKSKKRSYFSKGKFSRAFEYFVEQIPDDLKGLNTLLNKLNQLVFIHISVNSQANAFILFETLNNRGVPLSAIDIIKNNMLAQMEKQSDKSVDESYETWQELLSFLPDYRVQDRFLRQYYNAFKIYPDVKVGRYNKATASSLIGIYESLIKADANKVFTDLVAKAELYNVLIAPEDYERDPHIDNLVELQRIGAVASYTFLVYLDSLEEDSFSNKEEVLTKTVALLCKYYFRRNVTDFPNTRDMDMINMDLIESCHERLTAGEKLTIDFISDKVLNGKGKPSSLLSLYESLSDNLFDYNAGMARYALAKLDSISHSREYNPNLWERNAKDKFVWTVEHVFPQGPNIPKEWVEMIADGDEALAKEYQEDWVHCLGNLTLSGYNSKLSNHSFSRKQAKANATSLGKKIEIGYKNGLALNNLEFELEGKKHNLSNAPKWTIEFIEARNDEMVEQLIHLYAFEGEDVEVTIREAFKEEELEVEE